MRKFLYERGFIELLVPVIAPATDPGIRLAGEFKVDFYGYESVLTTSAILYKYVGLKIHGRIFYVATNIRKEPISIQEFGRSLSEFHQIDLEVARASMDDIIQLTEDLIVDLIETVKKERKEELERLGRELKVPSRPFKRYSYRDVVRIVMDEGYSLEEMGELSPKAE